MLHAPVLLGDAGAPRIAEVADADALVPISPKARLGPFRAGVRFAGYYYCAQGRLDATLTIDALRGDDLEGRVEFLQASSGTRGVFRVRGTYDDATKQLFLEGGDWVTEAAGWAPLDFEGRVGQTGTLTGRVVGTGCGTFYLSKRDAAAAP